MGEPPCMMCLLDEEGRIPDPARVELQRVYDADAAGSPFEKRVLVDRVWPRGIRKDALRIDRWAREVAPSDELRRWFGHRPERWPEFERRYREELRSAEKRALLDELHRMAHQGTLVLLYGAKDTEHNQAVVLRDLIAS
jgi:uncharacterized protein YeaO (DUF488 family)